MPKVKLIDRKQQAKRPVYDGLKRTLLEDTLYFYPISSSSSSSNQLEQTPVAPVAGDAAIADVPQNTVCYSDAMRLCPADMRQRDIGLLMYCMFSHRHSLSRACAEDMAPRLAFHCAPDIAVTCHAPAEAHGIRAKAFAAGASKEAREAYNTVLLTCLTTNMLQLSTDCAEAMKMPPPALPPTLVSEGGMKVAPFVRASGTGEVVSPHITTPEEEKKQKILAARAASPKHKEGVKSLLLLVHAVREAAEAEAGAQAVIDDVAHVALKHSDDDVWGDLIETHETADAGDDTAHVDSATLLGLTHDHDQDVHPEVHHASEDHHVDGHGAHLRHEDAAEHHESMPEPLEEATEHHEETTENHDEAAERPPSIWSAGHWFAEGVNKRPWLPVVVLFALSMLILVITAAMRTINWSQLYGTLCSWLSREQEPFDPYRDVPQLSSYFTRQSRDDPSMFESLSSSSYEDKMYGDHSDTARYSKSKGFKSLAKDGL